MWWVPLATATGFGLFVIALHFWHQRRQLDEARVYRARFVQLVAQLDTVTESVNALAGYVRQVREPKLLDYYESSLKILETLLSAVRRIPPFGNDPGMLDSAFFLVKDCRQRIGRTHQAFQDALRGRAIKYDELYGAPTQIEQAGCYFCSRPVIANRFAQVKVRIDGEVKQVTSCKICKDELESTKKVKVLYFLKEGKPVHWSEVADYAPSEDFWNINKKGAVHRVRHLELILTQPPEKLD
jgi:hypothetical protein